MEEKLSSRSERIPLIGIRIGLIIFMVIGGIIIYSAVAWIYEQIRISIGLEFAKVTVSFVVILIFILISEGFGFGFRVYRAIKNQDDNTVWIAQWIRELRICKYLFPDFPVNNELVNNEQNSQHQVPSTQDIITRPRRSGRIPMFSIEEWTEAVLDWDNRDTWRKPMKLSEFLAIKFGRNADGSPIVSDNTFYEWRKRVLKELHKQEQKQKEK